MAGVTPADCLDRFNGWRAVATLADIGQAALVGRIPNKSIMILRVRRQPGRPLFHNRILKPGTPPASFSRSSPFK